MIVGALIVKHVENLSDAKTIQAIQENPYMQYLLGLPAFTEKPVFVPELFVLVRKRLDEKFFNMLTLMLAEAEGRKPQSEDFFAKNVMKFLRGLLRLFFEIFGQRAIIGQLYDKEDHLVPVLACHMQWSVK